MRAWLELLPLVLALAAVGEPAPGLTLAVPKGRAILVDGEIGGREWSGAGRLGLADSLTLHVQQTDDYVYLAVQPARPVFLAVDLYLQPASGPEINLHASAKLGERFREEGKWPAWKWWNHHGWTANFARATSFDVAAASRVSASSKRSRAPRPGPSDTRRARPVWFFASSSRTWPSSAWYVAKAAAASA